MKLIEQNPKKSLNKAYLKEKVSRDDIENFKSHLRTLLNNINEKESEEHAKNKLTKFLYDTFYNGKNEINTKGRIDLAIYEENIPSVIIECKKPKEKYDIISKTNPNAKALHELILYYLRERIEYKNLSVKYLIATDIYEWFIFDEFYFDKYVLRNKNLVKGYDDWKQSGKDTTYFYTNIAAPFIKELNEEIPFTYFDLKDYIKLLSDDSKADDNKFLPIFKILSPAHLLNQPFANDSNSLNKDFYNELLHLIGLEEIRKDGKKLIQRKEEGSRDEGSLLENTIAILEQEDCLRKLSNPQNFGDTKEDKTYNVALELCITWINRILFLKLLEAQLLNYNRGNNEYKFLDIKHIADYDQLNKLFFSVLAKRVDERKGTIKEKFSRIPYLNSSLFEISSLEDATIKISSLDNSIPLTTYPNTVLKDNKGKRRSEQINPVQYLFEFLDAYDFTSEGTEAIQEDNKTLINASVLGLIFEKINGYKDGSFFTPGFITMYMCRESIRKVVLEKFRENGYACKDFSELKSKIDDRKKANEIINSIKICDPAVGSGHFLVSALNEIIAIKSDLKILCYRDGSRIKDYKIKVENDELIIIDEDEDEIFEYKMGKSGKPISELQELQEAIFHEKEIIIENCLFGVDLNPNSVKICRLRLWIELLKHSYYTKGSDYKELETLPNIDINIKKGNSLISRFDLKDDIKTALKNVKVKDKSVTIQDYRDAVNGYKTTNNKDEKEKVLSIINNIKNAFQATITDTFKSKSAKARGAITKLETEINSKQQWGEKVPKSTFDDLAKAKAKFAKIEKEKEDILTSAIYRNAFEWRFEFPEVLNNEGDFLGFDLVIGNPPWGADIPEDTLKIIKEGNNDIIVRMTDSFMFFLNKSFSIKKDGNGVIAMIIPDVLLYQVDNQKLRLKILDNYQLSLALNLGDNIFTDVARPSAIIIINSVKTHSTNISNFRVKDGVSIDKIKSKEIQTDTFKKLPYNIFATENLEGYSLISKAGNSKLSDFIDMDGIQRGVSPDLKEAFIVNNDIVKEYSLEKEMIKKTVTGGVDVKKYSIPKSDKLLIYTDSSTDAKDIPNIIKFISKYKKKITCKEVQQGKHPFYCLHRARSKDIFTKKEKVIGVITGDKIITAIDNNQIYPTDGLYLFCSNEKVSNKYLTAILNSRLITYFYQLFSLEEGRTLAQIKPSILQDVPIKQPSKDLQKQFEDIVDKITMKKKENINADVSDLEKEIDRLIYKLYALTPDEVKIVEA